MELFLRSPQVVLPADRIMERVWGWDSEAEINVVWVHISNLQKLRSIGSPCDHPGQPGAGVSAGGRGMIRRLRANSSASPCWRCRWCFCC